MKLLIVACLAVSVAICIAADDSQYTTKYDNIDLDEILKSDRLFNNYFKCLMENGKCTPDGRELKRVLPDALKTGCSKCNDKQRQGSERVLKFLIENRKDEWNKLQAKYDPEGVYLKKYEADAKKAGIKV